jgi:sodium/bile acid cotransporter 7
LTGNQHLVSYLIRTHPLLTCCCLLLLLPGLAAIVEHLIFLTFNIVVSWLLRFPEQERKAIIIMCSQKNLPTAATIISYFDPNSVGNLGLITVPCIVFYIMQLFIDSFIANTWASKYERLSQVEAQYKAELSALEAAADVQEGAIGTDVAPEGVPLEEGDVKGGLAAPPQREARLSRHQSGDDDEAALLQNVELSEVNPLQQPKH